MKDELNHSQNSSTSVKLIEKLFITGCLSDMLAVCHVSLECPYYLWHIRSDAFCNCGNKVEASPSTVCADRSASSARACWVWSCLSTVLLLSFICKGQVDTWMTFSVTRKVLIVFDDLKPFVWLSYCRLYFSVSRSVCVSTCVKCLSLSLIYVPVLCWTLPFNEVSAWHRTSFATTLGARRGASKALGPGKDLSDGSKRKTCTQAKPGMIYRAYFWEW